jgi:hypothetical protein
MSDSLTLDGILYFKGETTQVTETFSKRDFALLLPDDKHPQYIGMELIQDNCSKLDNFKEGDAITVKYNLQGREWKDPKGVSKFFNSLKAWYIASMNASAQAQQPVQEQSPFSAAPAADNDDPFS